MIGGLRGIAFANIGANGYEGVPMKVFSRDPIIVTPLLGFEPNYQTLTYDPVYGPPAAIGGLKLIDGRACTDRPRTFALGCPSTSKAWRTLLTGLRGYVFAYRGSRKA